MSDEELLDRIGLDPATGLRDVMSAIGPMLLGRLRRHARVRRYGDAEVDDVFQDALLRLLRPDVRAEIRRAGGEILPWLSRWGYWRLDDAARKRAAEAARASGASGSGASGSAWCFGGRERRDGGSGPAQPS